MERHPHAKFLCPAGFGLAVGKTTLLSSVAIPYPHISPDIVRFGPFALRWYGVMYVVGYVVGRRIARRRAERGVVPFGVGEIDALVGYLVIGMLIGARLDYVFVFDLGDYVATSFDS